MKVTRVQCGNPACGRPLNDSPSLAPSERKPCPDCGSLARVFETSGTALVGTVASVALTKIHEEVERHWRWLLISLVLTLASSLVGLVIVGLTGGLNNESIPYEGRLLRGVQLRRISAAQDRQAVELAEEPAELPPSPRAAGWRSPPASRLPGCRGLGSR